MAKSTQIISYKLFNSFLFLILTIASCYFVYRFLKFLNSIQYLAAISSESLVEVLKNFDTLVNPNTEDNKQLKNELEAALKNIATFKVSLWS